MRLLTRIRRDCGVEVPIQLPLQNPTVREMAAAIRELRAKGDAASAIARSSSNENVFPASHAQLGVWLPHRFGLDNSVPIAMQIDGPLIAPALARAFDELVRRHHVLRTTFALEGGKLVQRVAQPERSVLPTTDLSALDPASQERELRRIESEIQAPTFDLERSPGWRCMLVRLGAREHRLYLTLHHIVADAWALDRVLFRELESLYAAYALGKPLRLTPPPITYPDYAVWDQRAHSAESLATKLATWKEKLAGAPHSLDLPLDRPRASAATYRSGLVKVQLPQTLSSELQALARHEGVTLFMVLLAGFDLLLHRATGQDDLVVGTPVANRERPEVDNVLGCFLNELPIRTSLSGDPTLREVLQRARAAALDALSRQEVPFHQLVSALRVPRAVNRHPLFQVMFFLQEELVAPRFANVEVKLDVDDRMGGFDLLLQLREGAEGIEGFFEYNAALFDQGTVRSMAQGLERLLAAMVATPDAKLSALPVLEVRPRVPSTDGAASPGDRAPHRPPRGETEQTLADAWKQTLGVPDLAANDDFFALGGSSLQMLELLAAFEGATGVRLPRARFLESPTVEARLDRPRTEEGQPRGGHPAARHQAAHLLDRRPGCRRLLARALLPVGAAPRQRSARVRVTGARARAHDGRVVGGLLHRVDADGPAEGALLPRRVLQRRQPRVPDGAPAQGAGRRDRHARLLDALDRLEKSAGLAVQHAWTLARTATGSATGS